MSAYTLVLNHDKYTNRTWIGMAVLSVLCHIFFFSVIVFLPELRPARPDIPLAVEVDLISLSQGELQGQETAPETIETQPQPAEPARPAEEITTEKPSEIPESALPPQKPTEAPPAAAETEISPAISQAPKRLRVKHSLKKKTYNASKVISHAIAKMEKNVYKSRPRPVTQAIARLKETVRGTAGVIMRGATTGKVPISKKKLGLLDIYNAEIWHKIQKNWAFSEEIAQHRFDLEAVIIAKIMRDGKIRDIWFEKRSGSKYFDESALNAVKKSDPLPPLPEGFLGPYYEVGFRFNLSELQQKR
ncbi:MAG: TonB family protein [Deltaproteobacteria bacterium]|nr:TonB family protein [Deltaproteobacteria bacterium]